MMKEQPKSKVLIILIGVLLIANIMMLSFFFITKKKHQSTIKQDKKTQIMSYLKNDIGFTTAQLARYDSMATRHFINLKSHIKGNPEQRKNIYNSLVLNSFSDSGIHEAAGELSAQHKLLEIKILKHIREIRGICSDSQLIRFDTSFYKILWKRGEGYKENKK